MPPDLRADFQPTTSDSAEFWTACDAGVLTIRHCLACDNLFHYPRLCCPKCGAQDLDWTTAAGTGIVYSHTTVHVPFSGPEWSDQLPYTVVLVDLSEGPRMLSRMAPKQPRDVRSSDRVVVKFLRIGDRSLPLFRLDLHEQHR